MAPDRNDKIPTSSIVMKAIDAKTFSELEAFVKDLEARPTDRLLRDLPDLVALSESKASIIAYVLATKFRHAGEDGRHTIRESVAGTLEVFRRVRSASASRTSSNVFTVFRTHLG